MPTNDIAEALDTTIGTTTVANDNNNTIDANNIKQLRSKSIDANATNDGKSELKHNGEHFDKKFPYNRLLSSVASSSSSLHTLSLTNTNDSVDSYHNDLKSLISENYSSTTLTDFFIKNQIKPQTTSILRPGAIFVGSQQSGRSTYEVEVELKSVDLSKSYLSGYLKIQGLTESHPEIITFFESEIISENYSFFTDNKDWGSTDKIDIQHWTKFQNWRNSLPVKKILDKNYVHKNFLKHNHIYMRWKERFLVPDAKVENIDGASFAGFYYISFNQKTGNISGLYFHKSSEKFQQLELSYVPSLGVGGSYQFH